MGRNLKTWVFLVTAAPWAGLVWGQEPALTLEAALQRARERAPALVSARGRIEETRARLRGARALRDNPVLGAAAGHRYEDGPPADLDFGLSQTFELGGRRGGRIRAAEAALARDTATAEGALVRALRDVAIAFLRGLYTGERVRLARASEGYAAEVGRIAERRFAAGDVAALDQNHARGALARARAEARAAEAAEVLAKGELRALLGLDSESVLTLAGELQPEPLPELGSLLESASARPDVRALEADVQEAEGEIAVGKGLRWPDVTPVVRFEREAGTNILWGGLTLTLPLWNHGQEPRGVGEARASRLVAEREAMRRAARVEVKSSYEAVRLRRAAVEALADTAARLEENEVLARRSYEVGQIGLAEWLLVRRETVEARQLHLERRLEAGGAEFELLARAGALR